MEKKIVYVAYDGKEFPTLCACVEYEFNMIVCHFAKNFSLYDECKRLIPHDAPWGDKTICYIHIIKPTKELYEYLEKRFKKYEIDSPWSEDGLEFKNDLYFYDCDTACWRSLSDELKKLNAISQHFLKMFTEN